MLKWKNCSEIVILHDRGANEGSNPRFSGSRNLVFATDMFLDNHSGLKSALWFYPIMQKLKNCHTWPRYTAGSPPQYREPADDDHNTIIMISDSFSVWENTIRYWGPLNARHLISERLLPVTLAVATCPIF